MRAAEGVLCWGQPVARSLLLPLFWGRGSVVPSSRVDATVQRVLSTDLASRALPLRGVPLSGPGRRAAGLALQSLGLVGFAQLPPKLQIPVALGGTAAAPPIAGAASAAATPAPPAPKIRARCPIDFTPADVPSDGVYGLKRVTRHPTLWSMAFVGAGIAVASPFATHIVMFGMPAVLATIGGAHQDYRCASRRLRSASPAPLGATATPERHFTTQKQWEPPARPPFLSGWGRFFSGFRPTKDCLRRLRRRFIWGKIFLRRRPKLRTSRGGGEGRTHPCTPAPSYVKLYPTPGEPQPAPNPRGLAPALALPTGLHGPPPPCPAPADLEGMRPAHCGPAHSL